MNVKPMLAAEIAKRIGVTLDTFYKRRGQYHLIDGMPRPLVSSGRHTYDRASMEAWFTRHHPHRPPRPANDLEAPLVPASDDEWRQRLAQAYGTVQSA